VGELHDLFLHKFGPLLRCLDLVVEVHDLFCRFDVHIAANPFHLIFMNLLNITNSLEYVRYVINPSFLNL